jgi:hypothetical protein
VPQSPPPANQVSIPLVRGSADRYCVSDAACSMSDTTAAGCET